ncbi:MAG: 50S ribosomal protein L18 [Ignavibacteria bacterium]|nr:50S ribosomal protein L18 [Bacteroidota bacterium]MSQ46138.1 50S ribosomal protein L18 [Ignavibacteria bacterium]
MITKNLRARRLKIKNYVRRKIEGTIERPRLSVYRSLNQFYGQLVDDRNGKTLLALSTLSKELKEQLQNVKSKKEKSAIVGKALAEMAKTKNITNVVFDRNGFLYHGRIKSFADAAREGGLQF